jgi:cellulose synthase/poly-beta-1,6-N-acetylglucosamine synthase-like glycosyltransferase
VIALAHLSMAALALPALAACTYLFALTLLSARLPVPPRSSRRLRFDVIVPARDEAALIQRSVASLRRLDWPAHGFRLIVLADNCIDDTAALARAAGAEVVERHVAGECGKGYALRHAFEHSRDCGWADAVVVVDADARVSPNLLEAFACRVESGAAAVQAHYGVLNPADSWRTRLLAIAHGAFHTVRSRARERLRLSAGLRGNGWCVTHRVLEAVPYRAFSLTEDLEYGIALGLAGYRVHYAGEASADAEMTSSELVAQRQRQRWENGRFDLIRSYALLLLRTAVRRRDPVCLDLALDLLVLPLSHVAVHVGALIAIAAAATLVNPSLRAWLAAGAAAGALLGIHVLRGWQLSGRGAAGLVDLLRAPLYVAWKLWRVRRRGRDRGVWVPTRRRDT